MPASIPGIETSVDHAGPQLAWPGDEAAFVQPTVPTTPKPCAFSRLAMPWATIAWSSAMRTVVGRIYRTWAVTAVSIAERCGDSYCAREALMGEAESVVKNNRILPPQ